MGIYIANNAELRENVTKLLESQGYKEGVAFAYNDCWPEDYTPDDDEGYVERIVPYNNGSIIPFKERLSDVVEQVAFESRGLIAVHFDLPGDQYGTLVDALCDVALTYQRECDDLPGFEVNGLTLQVESVGLSGGPAPDKSWWEIRRERGF